MTGLEHQQLLAAGVSNDWLTTPNTKLDGRRPIDCLYSEVMPVLPKIPARKMRMQDDGD